MELLKMPRASENMTEGTVGAWLFCEGDLVEPGAPVVEIITEKAQFELECEVGGRLVKIFAVERATVPTNFVVAVFAFDGEVIDLEGISGDNDGLLSDHLQQAVGDLSVSAPAIEPRKSGGRVSATPRARKLASSSGINLEEIRDRLNIEGVIEEVHVKRFLEMSN